ncbi:ABC transporter ATP-binding protein, partial [Streptococcus mutans]|nr:ABC transporter ATP-binding protein [Streptococcus mutans]
NIYLLDEVTANLDVETESYVVKAIQKLGKHKTILTIAHRLKTIKNADAIMVLDGNGSISDIGKHSDLTKRSALYQRYLQDLD